MFKRAPRIRPVRRYPMPGYPVLGENREILYRPPEPRLSALARDLARPAIPLALASFLAQPPAVSAETRPSAFFASTSGLLQEGAPKQEQAPRRKIRRFSDNEIATLIRDLGIRAGQIEAMGNFAGPVPIEVRLTEAAGRQLLERFFTKNGILFKSRDGIDAIDPERKIGFEFLDPAGAEASKLNGREDLDQFLVVNGVDYVAIPAERDIVLKLQQAAEQYLEKLQNEGRLWKSAGRIVERLRSGDEAAAGELKKLGPDALADLIPFAAEKRVEEVIEAIFAADVKPLLSDLDSDDPQKRDAATNRLIELSEPVKACVEQELKKAEEEKRPEAAERCKLILQAIGD